MTFDRRLTKYISTDLTPALILACSVRQELDGHLGTRSAQCRKHITWYLFQDICYTQPWLANNWQWHQQYENQTFVSWSPVLSCFTGSMHANSSLRHHSNFHDITSNWLL